MTSKSKRRMHWFKMDLHLHTPGSGDYHEPNLSFLDILHQAEARQLDIIALTDHNTVRGYAAMMDEIEKLHFLVNLHRAEAEEERRLSEYRRLLEKIVVLPGFEVTANFGFHILGIFAPQTPPSFIEHVLLNLGVSQHALQEGDPISGSNTDVLMVYEAIAKAGGIAVAAHVNSSNGVMMLDKNWGGQTRIAYTQNEHLMALEVTDLTKKGRQTTARFFDGSKPEYPRRMHCIQGSDAHRLLADPKNQKHLGVGDRITEVLLPEASFEALRDMFASKDFARTRPYRRSRDPYDHIQAAQEEGASIVQSFHETLTRRNGALYNILCDICAMANTNGGTIYIGVGDNPKQEPMGVTRASQNIELLAAEVDSRITPKLDIEVDAHETRGKMVMRVLVPRGVEIPYAVDENKFYIRDETETSLAVRDEIVQLILKASGNLPLSEISESFTKNPTEDPLPEPNWQYPQTGVEIISTEKRNGRFFHTVRDLRNGNTVNNVTRKSARNLWHYAIIQHETHPIDPQSLQWQGDIAMIKRNVRDNLVRYDLAQREGEAFRVYYGVTPDGMTGIWQHFLQEEDH